MQSDIFISYKRNDKEKVFPIKDFIERNTGAKCWIDTEGIESDAQFANVIIKAIKKAPVFLFMYSTSHAYIEDYESDWTIREINFAQIKRKRIVFINIDRTPLTDWFELFFGSKQQVDALSDAAMQKLCKDLKKWLNKDTAPNMYSRNETEPLSETSASVQSSPRPTQGKVQTKPNVNMPPKAANPLKNVSTKEDSPEFALKLRKRLPWIIGVAAVVILAVVFGFMFKKPNVVVSELSNGDYLITVKNVNYTMKQVEGGTFQMGSDDSDAYDNEKPVHEVTLSNFYIGETEVTQALWKAVMGGNPSSQKGMDLPVDNVKWKKRQKFIRKLNSLTGKTFRLPTEAEWEYSARGGNKSNGYRYSGSDDIEVVAWFRYNSGKKMHPVKTKSPNELGLYDMSGNAGEWCSDWYDEYCSEDQVNLTGPKSGTCVYRGGTCSHYDRGCRVSDRDGLFSPRCRYDQVGFRIVLNP